MVEGHPDLRKEGRPPKEFQCALIFTISIIAGEGNPIFVVSPVYAPKGGKKEDKVLIERLGRRFTMT